MSPVKYTLFCAILPSSHFQLRTFSWLIFLKTLYIINTLHASSIYWGGFYPLLLFLFQFQWDKIQ